MKEQFIRSFIHGVANTTGTLTVLGIVTSIWYIINNISINSVNNDKEKRGESVENILNELIDESEENKRKKMLDKSEREKRLESYNILLESLKKSFKESKSSNSLASNTNNTVNESVSESVNESVSECNVSECEIEKIEQNELGQSFYAKANSDENRNEIDSKRYKKIFDKLLN